MENAHPVDMPGQPELNLGKDLDDGLADRKEYMSLVGSLLWIARVSMPQISYYVKELSRRAIKPLKCDIYAGKRLLRYLVKAKSYTRTFHGSGNKDDPVTLTLYSDASYGDINDLSQMDNNRKSTLGYLIYADQNIVSWKSSTSKIVVQSTCESELCALQEGTNELIWIVNQYEELNVKINYPIDVYTDNQAVVMLMETNKLNPKTKHMAIKLAYLRELVRLEIIQVKYISTHCNPSDILTKSLDKAKFKHFEKMIVNVENESGNNNETLSSKGDDEVEINLNT
jgi:hypothetical protein